MTTPRDQYRHGNLREAALDAALAMLAYGAPTKISMRAIAEQIGVAHRALYNHFTDRDALFAEIATVGFDRLNTALENVMGREHMLRAYLRFALSNPNLYDMMMTRKNSARSKHPTLDDAIRQLVRISRDHIAPNVSDDLMARRLVMQTWMRLHGGISLYSHGFIIARDDDRFIEEMLQIDQGGG